MTTATRMRKARRDGYRLFAELQRKASKTEAQRVVAECGCEIVGKRADGSALPGCGVVNFRYYGGRCKADDVRVVTR